ncbi:MAG: hypothetical protein AAF092_15065 [Pseudomonadota bacterium]
MRTFLFACALLPGALNADTLGVNFSAFPAGTVFDYSDSKEGRFAEVYMGERGGRHVMERRKGGEYGELYFASTFNAEGLEVERAYATGRTLRYAPYNCERVVGTCSHTVETDRGARRVDVTTNWKGDRFVMDMQFEGVANPRRRYFQMAANGVVDFVRENDRQQKLEAIRAPN